MMEILIFVILLYLGLKVAWWMVKATVFVGVSAVIIGALLYPSYLFWF